MFLGAYGIAKVTGNHFRRAQLIEERADYLAAKNAKKPEEIAKIFEKAGEILKWYNYCHSKKSEEANARVYEKAARYYERAHSKNSAGTIYYRLAEIYGTSLHRLADAARAYEKAYAMNGGPYAMKTVARLYQKMGRIEDAARAYAMGGCSLDAAIIYDKLGRFSDVARMLVRIIKYETPQRNEKQKFYFAESNYGWGEGGIDRLGELLRLVYTHQGNEGLEECRNDIEAFKEAAERRWRTRVYLFQSDLSPSPSDSRKYDSPPKTLDQTIADSINGIPDLIWDIINLGQKSTYDSDAFFGGQHGRGPDTGGSH